MSKNLTIRKSILNVLNQVDTVFSPRLSEDEKEELIEKHIPTLRRHGSHVLTEALLVIKEESLDFIGKENLESKYQLKRFQEELLARSIEARRTQGTKMPVERNYAEAPLFSVASPAAKKIIKLRNENGEVVEERQGYRKIEYKSKIGKYLTSVDFRNFGGLQRLWELKGKQKAFSFSFYELCEVTDIKPEGGNYNLIADSLVKLSTTSIIMDDYHDPALKKRLRTEIHNIIQSATIDREQNKASIVFNDYLHHGLKENNVIRINLSIFHDLSTVTGKILYPLLSSLLLDKKTLNLNVLIESLGILNTERKAVLKSIREALDDLGQSGVIEGYTFIKVGRSYNEVEIKPSQQLLDALEEGITVSKG